MLTYIYDFISPQSERSELGAFYFFQGFQVVTVVCVRVVTVIECAIGGLPKCRKFGCSGHTFQGCWLLLILMIDSTQKYVQLII